MTQSRILKRVLLVPVQLVANMEASAREARAKAAEGSKLLDKVAPSKDVWGSEVSEDIQLDKVQH